MTAQLHELPPASHLWGVRPLTVKLESDGYELEILRGYDEFGQFGYRWSLRRRGADVASGIVLKHSRQEVVRQAYRTVYLMDVK